MTFPAWHRTDGDGPVEYIVRRATRGYKLYVVRSNTAYGAALAVGRGHGELVEESTVWEGKAVTTHYEPAEVRR